MGVSEDELCFQRLLFRTRKACRDEQLSENVHRLRKAVQRLELVFIQLQGDRSIDEDVLMQYGRELQQMKVVVEAAGKVSAVVVVLLSVQKDVLQRLETLDSLPKPFPDLQAQELRRRAVGGGAPEQDSANIVAETEAVSVLFMFSTHLKTYRADLRRQLLGYDADSPARSVEEHEEEQGLLAGQLLRLTGEMKQQFAVAGDIIREDNARLDQMQRQTEDNKLNLDRESKILQHYAYKSCFDCMVVLIVILVIWSFIGMVLIMKVFPKR